MNASFCSTTTGSPSSPAPPQPSHLSPTKTLIQKFNTLGQDPQPPPPARVQGNPLAEPMYATIGRGNARMAHRLQQQHSNAGGAGSPSKV